MRIGSHSITYRGSLRLSAREDGTYAVEGDATESRGTGTVTLALTVRADGADGGATLIFTGTATADGRVTELPPESVTSAATRLLTRFAENLGTAAQAPPAAEPEAEAEAETEAAPGPEPEPRPASVFDTEIPPPSLMNTDEDEDAQRDRDEHPHDEPAAPPPAEAAHARRTMIGRSAEEVDHAPARAAGTPPCPLPRRARSAPPCAGPPPPRRWPWRGRSCWAARCADAADPPRTRRGTTAGWGGLDRPGRVVA
ncbi:Carbon monoxide dehydrogenase subunit G OS=Streptomyces tendae OX=1932 GN=GUR47_19915 PE=4 SV=1 [Streptomyces tendae]